MIRKAVTDDLNELCRIADEGKRQLKNLGIDQWQKGYPNREIWEDDVAKGLAWVAEEEGRVVAAFTLLTEPEPSYDVINGAWLTGDIREYASLHRVCVADEAKGRGIAGELFAFSIQKTRELSLPSLRIDTHPGNVPMRRAVEKAGFVFCGDIRIVGGSEDGGIRVAYELLATLTDDNAAAASKRMRSL